MSVLNKAKCLAASLSIIAISGCSTAPTTSDDGMVFNDEFAGTVKTATPAPGATSSLEEATRNIEEREAAYQQVIKEARVNGMIGGAARGALVGLLIDQSGVAVASGALIGGAIGAGVGDQFGNRIVQEHRNFLVREASLQRVIHAAQQDTANTRFDLLLSDELAAANRSDRVENQELVSKATSSLEEFRGYAVERAVALQEVMPLYDEHPDIKAQLLAELTTQNAMISQYDTNISAIKHEGR